MNSIPLSRLVLRPLSLLLWLTASVNLAAQETSVIERGAHYSKLKSVSTGLDEVGNSISVTNSYVQLETGLNFRNAKGEWEESKAEFVAENGWAVARKGQHKVALFQNLNADGAVVLWTPDGKRMRSHVYGLAYFDTASGQSVLIATVKDSQAQLLGDNVLFYADAFVELEADVRYTYTRGGFEQDIILREKPPGPEVFGFQPETTRLEVWTEFIEAERPRKQAKLINPEEVARGAEPLVDEGLGFGELGIGQGRTFRLGKEDPALSMVAKNWIETDDGGKFLVETVAVDSIEAGLESLPAKEGGAGVKHPVHPGRLHAGYRAPKRVAPQEAVPATIPRLDRTRDLALLDALSRPGLVLDYVTTNGSAINFTFRHDTTYYVTGSFTVSGTTTFDSGTVVKYGNTGSPAINVSGNLVFRGEMYRPVILTAKDDNTVGEAIAGSTGSPSGNYAYRALNLTGGATQGMTLQHFRIAHAATALAANSFTSAYYPLLLKHGQIANCQTAFYFAYGNSGILTHKLQNMLLWNLTNVFKDTYYASIQCDNITANTATWFNNNPTSTTVTVNTSLLTDIANLGIYTDAGTSFVGSASGVYAAAGGGKHYLAAASTHRNARSYSSIDTTLGSELRRMTTSAPSIAGGDVTVDTTLAPTVQRDTDALDTGYHYPPLDYLATTLAVANSTLKLSYGVALGHSGSSSVWLKNGSTLKSQGLPNQPNVLVRYSAVQEGALPGAPAHASGWATINPGGATTSHPLIDARFTSLYADQGDWHLYTDGKGAGASFPAQSVTLRDCQFYGGRNSFIGYGTANLPVSLNNNLWVQSSFWVEGAVLVTAFNQHWWNTAFDFWDGVAGSVVKNSVFDNVVMTVAGTTIENSHNGYVPTAATKLPGSTGNDATAPTFFYTSGGLGTWYHSTIDFLNDGNQSAGAAGLYHHTVQTTQVKDISNVDLGFHYIALKSGSPAPSDADGDGIPDYLEDRNGNNQPDSNETDPTISNTGMTSSTSLELFTPLR